MQKIAPWMILVFALVFAVAVRLRFLGIPLERDEGEYAYAAWRLLEGVVPYLSAYSMKLPGIYAAYAFSMALFGMDPAGIHTGLLIANAASIVLVFLIGERLLDRLSASISALAYAILSASPLVLGMHAHATHYIVLFALAGIYLLLFAIGSGGGLVCLASGLMFGLAFLMKQHGVFFIAFAALYLFWAGKFARGWSLKAIARTELLLLLGATLPYAAVCLLMRQSGAWEEFWFWTVEYAARYASGTGEVGLWVFLSRGVPMFMMALLASWFIIKVMWKGQGRGTAFFISTLLLFSVLSLFPGLAFRRHYFVSILPASAFIIGAMVHVAGIRFKKGSVKNIVIAAVVVALCEFVLLQRKYLLAASPEEALRMTYGVQSPFAEAMDVANFIASKTDGDDKVAVIGSEPEILFYAKRRSATGFLYTYEMMRGHPYALAMQRKMMDDVEQARPEYVVFVNIESSWSPGRDSSHDIFEWFGDYARKNLELVGAVDIVDRGRFSAPGPAGIEGASDKGLIIYKRREGL